MHQAAASKLVAISVGLPRLCGLTTNAAPRSPQPSASPDSAASTTTTAAQPGNDGKARAVKGGA